MQGYTAVCGEWTDTELTLTAAILILISVGIHTGWNLLVKSENPSAATFLVASSLGVVLLLPTAVIFNPAVIYFPSSVWLLLALTGVCQALYFAALAGAYRRGDLSIAYPLARTMPILIVIGITLLLGRGNQLTPLYLAGVVLIMAGILILPMKHFSDFSFKNYWNLTCLLALVAACGTAGYSTIDDEALRQLRAAPGMPVGVLGVTLVYTFLDACFSSLALGGYVLARRNGWQELRSVLRNNLVQALGVGLGVHLAYTLVLAAMNFATNVSYVVAFRQLSIPLGTALGVVALKEPQYPPRLAGAAAMFLGLVLVGLG